VEEGLGRGCGGVVGLVETRVLDCDLQVQGRRSPARSRDPVDAFERRGRAEREPQATFAREALLWREVVDVERVWVDPHAARGGRAVYDHERVAARPVHLYGHAGRRLVVRIGVDVAVDRVGPDRRLAGRGLADLRIVEV